MKPGDSIAQGKYTLLRKLRSSGMAEVWLARQHGTEGFAKDVVIKRILPHLAEDEKLVTMFLDEGRIAANLNHPNVVQIFDLGNDGSIYYIAMEYIQGHDLEQIQEQLKRRGVAFPVEYAVRIIADTCLGLAYAHDYVTSDGTPLNVVHRDVSPQNILVSETGVVKLIDFGIAKARTSSTRTQVGHTKGKICYMSPEQMMAKELDRRSDIFSAGVVLYEALCGVKPFDGDNLLACFHKLMKEGIVYPRQIRPDIHPYLEQIIMKSLSKERDNRYPTATAFRSDLEQYLRLEGISVGPEHLSDFLRWLFSPANSTEVFINLPRAPQMNQPPLGAPQDPRISTPPYPPANPANQVIGTGNNVPAMSNTPSPSTSSGYQIAQANYPDQTILNASAATGDNIATPPVSPNNSGFYASADPVLSHTGPSLGIATDSPILADESTGPSLLAAGEEGAFPIDDEDLEPYPHRRRSRDSNKGVFLFLTFFVLIVGGLLTAHFMGWLSSAPVQQPTIPPKAPKIRPVEPFQIVRKPPVRSATKLPLATNKIQVASKDKTKASQKKRSVPPVKKIVKKRLKPPVKPKKRKIVRRKRRRRGYGYLVIDSDIRARVSIDGSIDYIPVPMLVKRRLKAGKHRLFFMSPEGSKTLYIRIKPNKLKDLYVRLRKR